MVNKILSETPRVFISKLKFYNTNYREYRAIYNNYVICVYPYALHIFEIIKPFSIETITFDVFGEYFKKVVDIHHIDYKDQIDYDPCLIYEYVSGDKIYTENAKDNISLSTKFYNSQIDKIDKLIISCLRKTKLNKIETYDFYKEISI